MNILRPAIIFSVLCLAGYQSYGQKFVNDFLNIGVGARAHGMFGAVTASTSDGNSGYWNTAGLTDVEVPLQINAMHAKWFGGIANYDNVSVAKKFNSVKKSVAAFTFIRMGVDNIPNTLDLIGPDGSVNYDRIKSFSVADYAGIFSYAQSLDEEGKFSLGGNIKIIHRTIGSFGKAWGFGTDFGAKWRKGNLTLGVFARDITTTVNAWTFTLTEEEKQVLNNTGNEIPVSSTEIALPKIMAGIAYLYEKNNFSLLSELNLRISTDGTKAGILSGDKFSVDPVLGLEAGYNRKVFVRLGVGNLQSVLNETNPELRVFELQPNIGMGLKLGRLRVDYALTNVGSLSGVLASHIFSATLDFVPRNKTQN
jgi:hypothetical protein